MVFLINNNCPCCRTIPERNSGYHCEDCWDKYHNGERDKDWLDKEKYDKKHSEFEQRIRETG
jgi:hypothetical protein